MADLEDLYREIILDHYRSPRNRGELPSPPAHRVEGYNRLCGDEVVVTIEVHDGRLTDMKWVGQGCSISQASASLMSDAVQGRTLDEVRRAIRAFKSMMSIHEASLGEDVGDGSLEDVDEHSNGSSHDHGEDGEPIDLQKLGELAALQGVVKYPVRIKCATLSWNALAQGLAEVASSDA